MKIEFYCKQICFLPPTDQLQELGAEGDFPVLVCPPGPLTEDEKPPSPIDLAGKNIILDNKYN